MRYNGWANWSTWNVSLWLRNDAALNGVMRKVARNGGNYTELAALLANWGMDETPDGAAWDPGVNPELDLGELDALFEEERCALRPPEVA